MVNAPFLNRLENFALWILNKSPRIGLLVVKQFNTHLTWYSRSPYDTTLPDEPLEPPAYHFERMYHMPAFGEDE